MPKKKKETKPKFFKPYQEHKVIESTQNDKKIDPNKIFEKYSKKNAKK